MRQNACPLSPSDRCEAPETIFMRLMRGTRRISTEVLSMCRERARTTIEDFVLTYFPYHGLKIPEVRLIHVPLLPTKALYHVVRNDIPLNPYPMPCMTTRPSCQS